MADENIKTEEVKTEEEKNEVAEVSNQKNYLDYMDSNTLNKAYKNAKALSNSELLPERFQGRPDNILIAMDIASRGGFSLMQVMQNLYIVKGTPSWSGQFCLAAIKACGKYSNVKYNWVSAEDMNSENFGCYLTAIEIDSGEMVKGTTVNWKMVKAYGWDAKGGSQWKSNPEQMFKYRAAAYFARTECPEVLMGLQTADEVKDVKGNEEDRSNKVVITLDGAEVKEVN